VGSSMDGSNTHPLHQAPYLCEDFLGASQARSVFPLSFPAVSFVGDVHATFLVTIFVDTYTVCGPSSHVSLMTCVLYYHVGCVMQSPYILSFASSIQLQFW
jgi:hypothetical protein